jgi:hypothetical protein
MAANGKAVRLRGGDRVTRTLRGNTKTIDRTVVRALVEQALTDTQIALRVGCTPRTVRRIRTGG